MKNIPKDHEVTLKLSEVISWNFFPVIKKIVKIQGFYTCMYNNKKTLIVK